MLDKCLKQTEEGTLLFVVVVPRASKTEIAGIVQNRCKIKVKAPPVDGEANKAIVKALSKLFKISKSSVILKSGQASKKKCFLLKGAEHTKVSLIVSEIVEHRGK